jgi:hypothetical protein
MRYRQQNCRGRHWGRHAFGRVESPCSMARVAGLPASPLGDLARRWTLAATLAPLCCRLLGCSLGRADRFCRRCRSWGRREVEFGLRIAHRLGQHRTELVFGGRFRSDVGLHCAHCAKLRSANLNLKPAALGSHLNDEWRVPRRCLRPAWPA